MKNLFLKVWILLVVLTIASALVSNFVVATYGIAIILFLSVIKFLLVSFYFMNLRKAHIFWKVSIIIFVSLFSIITLTIL